MQVINMKTQPMSIFFLLTMLVLSTFNLYGQEEGCKDCPSLTELIEKSSFVKENPASDVSKGVILEDGKLVLSAEAQRLLIDSTYRNLVYNNYSFDSIPELLTRKEYYRALWHLVNAYPNNQKLAYEIALQIAKSGIKGDYYVSAFYTYAFFDPETMKIENGKPVLYNPEKIEAKMKLFQKFSTIP